MLELIKSVGASVLAVALTKEFAIGVVTVQALAGAWVWTKLGKRMKYGNDRMEASAKPQPKSRRLQRKMTALENAGPLLVNPFVNRTHNITTKDRILYTVGAVTLLPIRLIAAVVVILAAGAVAVVATTGVKMESNPVKQKPLPAWRRTIIAYCLSPLVRCLLFCFGYYWIPTKGKPASCKDAPMVVANHTSFLDPIYLCGAIFPMAVGAREHVTVPVIGNVVKAMQCVCVDRKRKESRMEVKDAIVKRCDESSKKGTWPRMLIFPEGTCTNGMALVTFKPGPFLPGLPVQPVLITYPSPGFDPSWVSAGPSQLELILRLLCRPINYMEVEWLDVYTPSEAEKKDVKLFAQNVQAVMAAKMNVPKTTHSYHDVVLQKKAMDEMLPPAVSSEVTVKEARKIFNVDRETIAGYLKNFAELDKDKTGRVSLEEFKQAYGFGLATAASGSGGMGPHAEIHEAHIEKLFDLLDVDDDGQISFRDYLLGLALSLDPEAAASDEASIEKQRHLQRRLIFRVIDEDEKGSVSVESIIEYMAGPLIHHGIMNSEKDVRSAIAKVAGGAAAATLDFDQFSRLLEGISGSLQVLAECLAPPAAMASSS